MNLSHAGLEGRVLQWESEDMRLFEQNRCKLYREIEQANFSEHLNALQSLFTDPDNYRPDVESYCKLREQTRQYRQKINDLTHISPSRLSKAKADQLQALEKKLEEKRQLGVDVLGYEFQRATGKHFPSNARSLPESSLQDYKATVDCFHQLYGILEDRKGIELTQRYKQGIEELEQKKKAYQARFKAAMKAYENLSLPELGKNPEKQRKKLIGKLAAIEKEFYGKSPEAELSLIVSEGQRKALADARKQKLEEFDEQEAERREREEEYRQKYQNRLNLVRENLEAKRKDLLKDNRVGFKQKKAHFEFFYDSLVREYRPNKKDRRGLKKFKSQAINEFWAKERDAGYAELPFYARIKSMVPRWSG